MSKKLSEKKEIEAIISYLEKSLIEAKASLGSKGETREEHISHCVRLLACAFNINKVIYCRDLERKGTRTGTKKK